MRKSFRYWMVAGLTPAVLCAALAGLPARAQSGTGEIASAARIYGYDLAEGNWTLQQVECPVMPNVSLLQYRRTFPDGTESRLTAVVPLSGGRVRIVPVLHRNATPFVPAPENPRNYKLFNQLVGRSAAKGTWLDLSACYAALTGAGSGLRSEVGIAGAPKPMVHVDAQGKIHRVTFATPEGKSSYTVWSVSLNQYGRVTAASAEEKSAYAAKEPPPVVHRPRKQREGAAQAVTPQAPAKPTSAASVQTSSRQPSSKEVGWKIVPRPPDPPFKIIPNPPQPSEAVLPNP